MPGPVTRARIRIRSRRPGPGRPFRGEAEALRRRLSELESGLGESQAACAALQKSAELYRIILENIPPVTYVIALGNEPLNSTIYSSPQIERIVGHASGEFLRDPLLWVEMVHPQDRGRVLAASEHADLTGEPFDAEYRVVSRDRGIAWFHDESVLVRDEQGRPRYRVGILNDVTERKRAELALRQLEDIYQQAIKAAGAVPYVISHEGRWNYAYIGEGIQSLTGYSAGEMTADVWDSLRLEAVPRGRLAGLTFEEADRLTNEQDSLLWECDFHIRTRDGQARWIADTSVKGIDEKSGRRLSVGIYQDITGRKQAEAIQAALIRELEQRNAELERLAYTLSHELKSPLITIRGFMGYLREDALRGNLDRFERDLTRINEATDKMLRLINELIDLMSVGRSLYEPREIPLRPLVEEAVGLAREALAKGNVSVDVADDLPVVFGDRNRLLEVLQNLLENAARFMGEQPSPRIEIGQRAGEPAPTFYVRDNGIGIEPRFHERIFGIFQKLDAQSEGTGIGLALVRRILEVHGGRIWVESQGKGQGSTFCFTLPRHRDRQAHDQP